MTSQLHSYAQPPIPRREVPTMREWLERHQEPQPGFWERLFGKRMGRKP